VSESSFGSFLIQVRTNLKVVITTNIAKTVSWSEKQRSSGVHSPFGSCSFAAASIEVKMPDFKIRIT
jgi:hypothetical protein